MSGEPTTAADRRPAGRTARARGWLRFSRSVMLAALLAAALVSFALVRAQQGSGGLIVRQQSSSRRLLPAAVSRVVKVARSPGTHGSASSASCRPGTDGFLRNSWTCTLQYAHHERISWVIQVLANGRYVGVDQTMFRPGQPAVRDAGVLTGCCIAVP